MSTEPITQHSPATQAWLEARSAATEVNNRISSAVRDRPKINDPRFQEYQDRVVVPLIAERKAATEAVKTAFSEMHEEASRPKAI